MPERKVNPKLVALALARGATQVEAYGEAGGESDHPGLASEYCNRDDVLRLRAYYELDEMDRLKALLRLADDDARSVLSGDEPGVNRLERSHARQYAAQRERTPTAVHVEIGHKIEFKGLQRTISVPGELKDASVASQEHLDATPAVPALPESTATPLPMGDVQSPSRAFQVPAPREDTTPKG